MRAREGVVQDSPVVSYQEGKDYASKVNFNCMATSGSPPTPQFLLLDSLHCPF